MSSTQLRRLNSYSEFRTQAGLNSVIAYVHSLTNPPLVFPAGLNVRQRARFIQKFGQGDWRVANNVLFYNPPTNGVAGQGRINLEVIAPNPAIKQARMTLIYNNVQQGLAMGLNKFYYQVSKQCLNITKAQSAEFMRRQGDWQISRPLKHTLNHPILARTSNEKWQIDCIDLNPYRLVVPPNPRYIMSVIDVFSKKVFARAINNQTSATCRTALNNIIITECGGQHPRLIQTDGGTSFVNQFHQYLVANNITHLVTRSHTPTQNSLIERANLEIRRKIRALIVANNNIQWRASLQNICININNQKASTGFTPNELWNQGYNAPANALNTHIQINDRSSLADIREKAEAKAFQRAVSNLEKQHVALLAVGDIVRVKIEAFNAEMRQRNKEKQDVKYNAVTYTPETFRIHRVIAGNIPQHPIPPNANTSDLYREKYIIENMAGVIVRVNNAPAGAPKQWYGSDLIKVPNNSTPAHVTGVPFGYSDFGRGRYLNRFPAPYL